MNVLRICKPLLLTITLFLGGCGLLDDSATKKPSNSGLIATPVTYYSTSRARYLGAKYKENLDRLVERIVRNPKTANLQFANNIASVGGIGFFTHSATKTADERYLEVVLAAPETFETKGSHSNKLSRLFSVYGLDLLTILSGDNDIYLDKELTGYGLNLSWRNVIADPAGNRVTLERAIVYLSKEKTRSFLRRDTNQNALLADATIFAVEEDGPLNLISYRAPEVRQEYGPAIREDDIAPTPAAAKPSQPPPAVKTDAPEQGKKEALPLKEPVAKVAPPKLPVAVAQKTKPLPPKTSVMPETPAKPTPPTPVIAAPVEAPVVEAAPVDFAKVEVPAPGTSPAAETKEVTPVVKPIVKSPEPTRAVMEAPKPVVAQKIPSPPVVDVAPPAVVAPAPRAERVEPPAIQAKPIERAAPARVVDAPKPPVVEVEPFLPLAPPVAASVPAPETPKIAKPAPLIAVPEAKPVEIVSAPPDAVTPAPSSPPVAASFSPPAQSVAKSMPPVIVARVPAAAATPTAPAETKPVEIVSAPPVAVKPAPPQMLVETPRSVPVQTAAKSAPPVIETPARTVASPATPVVEKPPAKATAEQLASLVRKPPEAAPIKPAVARPAAPKPLEGFIIQLAFNDKESAQRWAEGMEKKGFAVSVTEAGTEGALRVRLGNFALRDDAERQLKAIKQEGLNGIILNLPQAFRPEARTSIP